MNEHPEGALKKVVDRLVAELEAGAPGDTGPRATEGAVIEPPEGYLGSDGRLGSGPSPALVDAGYRMEVATPGSCTRGCAWPIWPM